MGWGSSFFVLWLKKSAIMAAKTDRICQKRGEIAYPGGWHNVCLFKGVAQSCADKW